jgi:hypothetical protein
VSGLACTCMSPLGYALGRHRTFPPPEVNPGCPVHDRGLCRCEWRQGQREDGTWWAARTEEAADCPLHALPVVVTEDDGEPE